MDNSTWDKNAGAAKKQGGKLMNDSSLQGKGDAQQTSGNMQQMGQDAANYVKGTAEELKNKMSGTTNNNNSGPLGNN